MSTANEKHSLLNITQNQAPFLMLRGSQYRGPIEDALSCSRSDTHINVRANIID